MKKIVFLVLISALMVATSMAQKGKKNKLENQADSVSYAIGVSIGNSIKNQNVTDLNLEKLYMAIEEVLGGEETRIKLSESQKIIQSYMVELKEIQKKENLNNANKFLEENKNKEGVIVIQEGLQYKVIKEGAGECPLSSSKVKTHYEGTLLDGTVFDSSYKRGKPIEFKVGGVIKGWQEALKLMKPGAKWMLYIHPDLGYGERTKQSIPANSLLIFEIELLSFE